MKTKFFLTLTMVCLLLACSSGQSLTQTDSSKMETISLAYSLFPDDNHYTIKIGQRMEYVFESNTSVGKDFACYVYSTEILKFVGRVLVRELKKDKFEFLRETIDSTIPIRVDKSTTGDNRRIGKFVFEGIKEGTSTLVIHELFRFKVQQEMVFTITVEK